MINDRPTTNAIVLTMASGAIHAALRNGDATTLLNIALDGIKGINDDDRRIGNYEVTGDISIDRANVLLYDRKIADGMPGGIDPAASDRLKRAFGALGRKLERDGGNDSINHDTARQELQKAAQATADAVVTFRQRR